MELKSTMGLKCLPQMESGVVQRTSSQSDLIRITFTDQGIAGTSEHLEELDAIRGSQDGDTVVLYFSGCPGGSLDTGFAIMNAIMATNARVVAIMEGLNCSLATLIPMVCDEVIVTPFSAMMVHSANTGAYGTVGNVERYSAFTAAQAGRLIEELYEGFLTEEEIVRVKDGVELYLSDTDIEKRLTTRAALLVTKLEAELAEVKEAIAAVEGVSDVEVVKPAKIAKKAKNPTK